MDGGIKVLHILLHRSWLAFLHVLVQPLKAFEQSFTRRGATAAHGLSNVLRE
jgi:hypothetical protein